MTKWTKEDTEEQLRIAKGNTDPTHDEMVRACEEILRLQEVQEKLVSALEETKTRLLMFAGAVADVTDVGEDVDVIKRAESALELVKP